MANVYLLEQEKAVTCNVSAMKGRATEAVN